MVFSVYPKSEIAETKRFELPHVLRMTHSLCAGSHFGIRPLNDITIASSSCFRDQYCVAPFWPSCHLSAFILLHSDQVLPLPSRLLLLLLTLFLLPPLQIRGSPCGRRSDGDAAAGLPGETSPAEAGGELSESTTRKEVK